MRSAKSFFDAGVFWKTVRRFWPVWGIYGFIWFLALPLWLIGRFDRYGINIVNDILGTVELTAHFLCPVAACAAAMAAFSHLYNERSANFYAALPVRREGMFVSCAAAGLLPLIAVNALIALISLAAGLAAGYNPGAALAGWFAAVSLECLAYFGIAALCALVTGNIVIMPLLFIAVNFAAYALASMAIDAQRLFFFGYSSIPSASYDILSPVVAMIDNVSLDRSAGSYLLPWRLGGWGWLLGYGALGALLLPLALLCYRRRNMESAGDAVAIAPLRPVVKALCSLLAAFIFGSLLYGILLAGHVSGLALALLYILCMAAGAFIGWFGAEMLVDKSFKVFKPRGFLGWALVSLLCAAFVLGCEFDVTGYERRVPELEDVVRLDLYCEGQELSFGDSADIGQAREIHEQILASRQEYKDADADSGRTYVRFEYKLRSGGELHRAYTIPQGDTVALVALDRLMNRSDVIQHRKNAPDHIDAAAVEYAYIQYRGVGLDSEDAESYVELSPAEAAGLYNDCILPDMRDGNIGIIWFNAFDEYADNVYDCEIYIDMTGTDPTRSFSIVPTVFSVRTNEWLSSHGIEPLTCAETGAARYNG